MNRTKIKILNCLCGGGWWMTSQVAQGCGLSQSNTSELLRRYRGQGLVHRKRNYEVPRGYLYRITNVGIGRLEYLSGHEIRTSDYLAARTGLSGARKRVLDRWVKDRLRR